MDLDGEAGPIRKREADLIGKRQDSEECKNLGCPAGYIPYMGSEGCYCGLDGDFSYPQSPASMGSEGIIRSGVSADQSSPVPVNNGDKVLGSRQRSTDLKKKRQNLDACKNLGCPAGFIPTTDGNACSCAMDGGFPYPQGPASLGPQYPDAVEDDENDVSP